MRLKDQLKRPLQFKERPARVVSLVPSITEMLFDLGLNHQIKGITKFCHYPENLVKSKTRIGGTKTPDLEKIAGLEPDFIIANKEENRKEDIAWLEKRFPVYVSDVISLQDAYDLMRAMGKIFRIKESADDMIAKIISSFMNLPEHIQNFAKRPPKVLYLIWKDPYMVAGSNTFINEMLTVSWLKNTGVQFGDRYPKVTPEQIADSEPDIIMLSSEPFPFKEKHRQELRELIPLARIVLVDGRYFSWYGSRLLYSAQYVSDFFTKLR